MLALELFQPVNILLRDRKGDDADRHDFEFFTDRVDFLDLGGGKPANHRAAVGNALHQALLLQLEKREPDIAAMGLKQVAEVLLDEALPRLPPPENNVFLDAPANDRGCRGFARRRCDLAGFRRSRLYRFGQSCRHQLPTGGLGPARHNRRAGQRSLQL